MRKRFWKIEYSITIFVVFGIILLLLPSSFITSKEATYITKWNDTYNKVDTTVTVSVNKKPVTLTLQNTSSYTYKDTVPGFYTIKSILKQYIRYLDGKYRI